MSRRLVLRLGSLIALGAALVIATPPSARALAPTAHAYWVKGGSAPPTVPAGGLFVGDDPGAASEPGSQVGLPTSPPTAPAGPSVTGYTGVSAVRIEDVSDSEAATLTLVVAPDSVLPQPLVSTIVACPIPGGWTPPPSGVGDMADAPAADCSQPSVGRVAGDSSSISFSLPVSFQTTPGRFDILILPGPATPAPFEVGFEPPDSSTVSAASGTPPPSTTTTQPPPPTTLLPSSAGIVSPGGPVALPSFAAESPAPTAAAVVPAVRAAAPSAPTVPSPVTDEGRGRMMAAIALALLAAAMWWLSNVPTPLPHHVGPHSALGVGSPPAGEGGAIGP